MEQLIINTTDEQISSRLDVLISIECDNISRNAAQHMIEDGKVLVNGKNVKKNYKICKNDVVTVDITVEEVDILPEDIPLDVIFEDDDLIIVNKAKGMVVHPANGHYTGTLVNALMFRCKDSLSGINGKLRPGIVHRIDMDTSGLIMVAKNDISHNNLAAQIKEHSAGRIYEAIVHGNIKDDEGTINKPIGRHRTDRKKMSVTDVNSKEAITHFEVIARYNGYTHMYFKLETGRTHQIRVHMASLGHPIVGDYIYNAPKNKFGTDGQCLHAKRLVLKHPKTDEQMSFESETPKYFTEIIEKISKR